MARKKDDNIIPAAFDPNTWAKQPPEKAVTDLFQDAIDQISESIRWYREAKGAKARLSSGLRVTAILSGVLGGLMPIVAGVVQKYQLPITQAGYILVGIAAGALAFDRFFGLSSGWIRYMNAMTVIERLRMEYILDWAKMQKEADLSKTLDILKFLDRWTVLRNALAQVVKDETDAWANEFRASMADLDEYLQDTRARAEATLQEVETQRAERQAMPTTGALNLSLAADWEGEVEVTVENEPPRRTAGRKIGFSNLKPGSKDVLVVGNKNGKKIDESSSVTIEAGKTATLAL